MQHTLIVSGLKWFQKKWDPQKNVIVITTFKTGTSFPPALRYFLDLINLVNKCK